jgi:Tol biopolymer transport system component
MAQQELRDLGENADGAGVLNLTNNPATDSDPAWSPDGSLIAFTSNRGGTFEIYVMRSNGANPRRLTRDGGGQPCWSPDGSKIAFINRYLDNADIFVMDSDGNNVVNLTKNQVYDVQPVWSPFVK